MTKGDLIQWCIASGGWIVAILTVWTGYRERIEAREEGRFEETLQYFTGGTQKRSVGIALVEGVWRYKPQYLNILVPVISNQIVYLLLVTDSKDEVHEERNLIRLLNIFSDIPSLRIKHDHYRYEVLDAIGQKLQGQKSGLKISSQTLQIWQEKLKQT